ncbi:MAG: hypothetical protein M1840_000418 [Geoglossum simile]|nr:MAG: hypothetical protein M1840_000418 [Geoglossum simile]
MASKTARKRKTSVPTDFDEDAVEQRKRDKKRVQNRLSQQCYREKQASYIKQLERFVENVQAAGSGSADIPSQLQEMQRKQLRLMKENQELREAILRMRKKLLSLSTAASTSADDVIFERILNAPADDDNAKTDETLAQEAPILANEAQNPFPSHFACSAAPPLADLPPTTTPDSLGGPLSTDPSNQISNSIPMSNPDHASNLNHMSGFSHMSNPDHTSNPNHMSSLNHTSNSISMPNPNHTPNQITMPTGPIPIIPQRPPAIDDRNKHHLTGDIALRFNTILATPPIPPIPNSIPLSTPYYPSRESFRLDPADYSDLVMEETERSVRDSMAKMRFGFFRDAWSQWTVARQFTPQQIDEIDHMTLTDLCRIAFRIVLKASALEKYVYAGGTLPTIAKVLRWRITPTIENRAAIAEPFRPTPLQQLVRDRHPSIDFIHWGELRDQLIIYMGAYNMQTLIMDTLQFLVREVPQLNIAIPVLEFYNALAASTDPAELMSPETNIIQYDPLISYNPNPPSTMKLVRKYGLDRILERKLMPAFAKKYPFLDISSSQSLPPSRLPQVASPFPRDPD